MEGVEEQINLSLSVKLWQCTHKVCIATLNKANGLLKDQKSWLEKMHLKAESLISR